MKWKRELIDATHLRLITTSVREGYRPFCRIPKQYLHDWRDFEDYTP